MPVSGYKLVYQDPDFTKLASSSKLEIGTSTTNKIKVVGSCVLYAVHPDTQCLQEVTFHVTSYEGSVVLSCMTTLALSLIQPCTSLDCLPPSASLISSSADHPMKTKSQMNVQVLKPDYTVCPMSHRQGRRSKLITCNDKHIHVVKQSAEVSMQQSMRPKFNTSKEQSPALYSKVLPSHVSHVG